jgi:hypothetical protein
MLLVVVSMPTGVDAPKKAVAATGLAPADVSRRLAGVLPRVLLADSNGERLAEAARQLEDAGFRVITCDPASAPDDRTRVVARRLSFEATGLVAHDAAGDVHALPAASISFIQRGHRSVTHTEQEVVRETKVAFAPLLLFGIPWVRRKQEVRLRTREARDAFVAVHRSDGEPDLIIYERRLDYRFLGRDMTPSSRANLDLVVRRIQQLAPAAPVDDRIGRPGFVEGLPATSVDPVDLGLFLVLLAHLRVRTPYRG